MPWLKVDADTIQIDAAGIIDVTGRAPEGLEQNGITTTAGGELFINRFEMWKSTETIC